MKITKTTKITALIAASLAATALAPTVSTADITRLERNKSLYRITPD
ncbi:hypothetical protein AB9K41_18770 [Cribrihabitans sp. XS_ASV171]